MDFTTDFLKSTTTVLQEAAKLKKYKAMPLWQAIVTGIFMLPIAVVCAAIAVVLYVVGYIFSVASLPIQKLHALLHTEGQSVKHATQFIIYFLSWSVVFTSYAVLTFFTIALTALYTLFSITAYLFTLGGFKFHVFAGEEDISVVVDEKYPAWVPLTFLNIMVFLLILLPLLKTLALYSDIYASKVVLKDFIRNFVQLFKAQVLSLRPWRFLASAIYSAAVFAPNPKKN